MSHLKLSLFGLSVLYCSFLCAESLQVQTQVVKSTLYQDHKAYPAKVMAHKQKYILSGEGGYVSEIYTLSGQPVQKGTPLVQITPYNRAFDPYIIKSPCEGLYIPGEAIHNQQARTSEIIGQVKNFSKAFLKFHIPEKEIGFFHEEIDLTDLVLEVRFKGQRPCQLSQIKIINDENSSLDRSTEQSQSLYAVENFSFNPLRTDFHTFEAYAQVSFADRIPAHQFLPASFHIHYRVPETEKILISSEDFKYEQGQPTVYLVENDRIKKRVLKISSHSLTNDHFEVFEGLELGEEYVASNYTYLTAGTLVERVSQ